MKTKKRLYGICREQRKCVCGLCKRITSPMNDYEWGQSERKKPKEARV